MTDRERDIKWIKSFLGESFSMGVWIKGRVAKVILTDGRDVLLSLPSHNRHSYNK